MRTYDLISPARTCLALLLMIGAAATLSGQSASRAVPAPGFGDDPPALASLVTFAKNESDLRIAVERYLLDKAAIERRYEMPYSPARDERLKAFHATWQRRLAETDVDALNPEGCLDYVMLRNRVTYDAAMLDLAGRRWTQMAPLLPFFDTLRRLPEARHDRQRADPRATATTLSEMATQIGALGRWSPQQAIDFLVERVGHERANAEGEVRRTTIDAPLYQAAYLLGGLQFRSLRREFVTSGRMTATAFHDAVLTGGYMPVERVRARLSGSALPRDHRAAWRFDGR